MRLPGRADAKAKAIEALMQVRIARPEERYHAYPFELSGGMCQRDRHRAWLWPAGRNC